MQKLSLLLIWAALLAGCGSKEVDSGRGNSETAQPAHAVDEALYVKAAENLVAASTRTLRAELMTAVNQKGVVAAIGVCAAVAPQVMATHSVGGWSGRRVSDRFRNPDNRADTTQQRILQYFAASAEDSPSLVEWSPADSSGSETFRFYQPIRVAALCVKCHGDMQTLAPGVLEELRRHYPTDRATGYREGDLRGLYVVEATWPSGRDRAVQLASDETPPPVSTTPPPPPVSDTPAISDTAVIDSVMPAAEDTIGQG